MMHGYDVETLVGEDNCPLLLSKVRAMVISSLAGTPTGLTPDQSLVRSRIMSSLETLVGKRIAERYLRAWVSLCGTTWPLASILFNIRLGTSDAKPILMVAERMVLTSLKEAAASRVATAIHWETVSRDKEVAEVCKDKNNKKDKLSLSSFSLEFADDSNVA